MFRQICNVQTELKSSGRRPKSRKKTAAPLSRSSTHTDKKTMRPSSSAPPPAAVGVPELASTARTAAFAEVSRLLQHPAHLRRLPQLLDEYEAKRKARTSFSMGGAIKRKNRSFVCSFSTPTSKKKTHHRFFFLAPTTTRPTPLASPRPSGPRSTQPGTRRRFWPRPLPPSPGSANATG